MPFPITSSVPDILYFQKIRNRPFKVYKKAVNKIYTPYNLYTNYVPKQYAAALDISLNPADKIFILTRISPVSYKNSAWISQEVQWLWIYCHLQFQVHFLWSLFPSFP